MKVVLLVLSELILIGLRYPVYKLLYPLIIRELAKDLIISLDLSLDMLIGCMHTAALGPIGNDPLLL